MARIERPPIVVVMGHVDHGKSTLLDYIRKTNVVEHEAGGITQHVYAYEVEQDEKRITFIDTPGHEAYTSLRQRGSRIADIAILLISAVEGIKTQTLEALNIIKEAKIPYIVALNKIDKPEASPDKVKQELAEKEIFVEGYGGKVPCALISAKTGKGVPELLELLLIVAEMEELDGDLTIPALGVVVESHLDHRRGASATLIIRDGTLKKGMYLVVDETISPIRSIEDTSGKPLVSVSFSSPVRLSGLSTLPHPGSAFKSAETKKEAESIAKLSGIGNTATASTPHSAQTETRGVEKERAIIPLTLKADVFGSLEALLHEIKKIESDKVKIEVVHAGVGNITENDLKLLAGATSPLVIGFNVKIEKGIREVMERLGIECHLYDVIYRITEELGKIIEKRVPANLTLTEVGRARILRIFEKTKERQIIGGSVSVGKIVLHAHVSILRHNREIGKGTLLELQHLKQKTNQVEAGNQFGALIETKTTLHEDDEIAIYEAI